MIILKKINIKILLYLLSVLLIACNSKDNRSQAAMVSVSSDGEYVVSTHFGKTLIIWDVNKKNKQVISKDVNELSLKFIQDSHRFIWQDVKSNTVHVYDIDSNKEIKAFALDFTVFGHVMDSTMKKYVACDEKWNLYEFYEGKKKLLKGFDGGPSYDSAGKLLNLTLVNNYLLTTGLGSGNDEHTLSQGPNLKAAGYKTHKNYNYSLWAGTMLWDLNQQKPIQRLQGPFGKMTGTLSPDGKYVVAVDENIHCIVFDAESGQEKVRGEFPVNPETVCYDQECRDEIKKAIKEHRAIPKDFYKHPYANGLESVAVKFIDEQGDYLRFISAVNYATLYNVNSPEVKAYMNFGKDPQPDSFSVFSSANVIDTAPKANILVMGQVPFGDYDKDEGTGIIVYHFDAKTKTLKRLWAPEGPPAH